VVSATDCRAILVVAGMGLLGAAGSVQSVMGDRRWCDKTAGGCAVCGETTDEFERRTALVCLSPVFD